MTDWEFWVRACQPFVDAAEGMILYQMPGWGSSMGIKAEFGQFWDTGRPIRLLPLDTSFRGLTFLEVCLHDIRR
jgi:hypothetical protein